MRTIRRLGEPSAAADPGQPTDPFDPSAPRGGGRDDGRLSGANKLVLAMFFFILVAAVAGSLVHLPYAVMSPGPIVNTLGTTGSGDDATPLIEVTGLPSYPAKGQLDFTTVRVTGGPSYPVDAWDVVEAWLDSTRAVLPVDEVFDPTVTEKQVEQESAVQMASSQEEATAVALRAIGQKVPTYIVVSDIVEASKATGLLQKQDRLVSVGGEPVTDGQSIRTAIQKVTPGDPVTIGVVRDGKPLTVSVPTIRTDTGQTAIGVLLAMQHDFPATVTINAGDVGGPSAGLMFSLGIYDTLTPGDLTGGIQVAGTGTIDDAGVVGPIGGIRQKLAGARAGGAGYFLAPASNCKDVVGHVPDGLEVFKVATFAEARVAVEAIASKQTGSLPRC
ncbi:MAG: PDZ domain-containing protein [Terracoccus sp.]